MKYLKRLRVDHWFWIHAKCALIVWGLCYILYPPPGPLKELGPLLNNMIAMFAIVGSVVAIAGLVISTSHSREKRFKDLTIELVGLLLAVCGPATYCSVQVALIADETIRIAVAAFGYAFTSFMLARIVVVIKAMKAV